MLLKQSILIVFGGGSAAAVWLHFNRPEANIPLAWTFFAALLVPVCLLAFVRNLLGLPRFEVSGATGAISLFKRRAGGPWKTIRPDEIECIRLEVQPFVVESEPTDNLVLLLIETSGKRRALCASPDLDLIRSLGASIAWKTQRRIEEGPWDGRKRN